MNDLDTNQPPEPANVNSPATVIATTQPTAALRRASSDDHRLQAPPLLLIGLYAGFVVATVASLGLMFGSQGMWWSPATTPMLYFISTGIFYGMMLGGAALAVVLATLHRGPIWLRLLLASLVAGTPLLCMQLVPVVYWLSIDQSVKALVLGIVRMLAPIPALILIAQLPVWAVNLLRGAYLRWRGRLVGSVAPYRIRDVLMVTAMVAVSLALAKTVAGRDQPDEMVSMVTGGGLFAFFASLLLCVPCMIAALWPRRKWIGGLCLGAYVLIPLSIYLLALWLSRGADALGPLVTIASLLIAPAIVYFGLLLVRRYNVASTDHVCLPPEQREP